MAKAAKKPDLKELTAEGPLIAARDVSVVFGANAVLRDITLEIPRGETLAIIGESGCGKTVFLKTLIGLVRPTSGQVVFDGRDMMRLNDRQLTEQRLRFGYVFQMAALFDSLTVAENITFPLRQNNHHSEDELQSTVRDLLTGVGLAENVLTKKPAELSGGMRKRVGLARALAMKPEVVLYDEPTTGLDPIMSDVINELIIRTRERTHVTGIVVTHDMHSARKVADRVVMFYPLSRLERGEPQIIFDGPPEALDDSPDPRVTQFVRGEAGERLMELGQAGP